MHNITWDNINFKGKYIKIYYSMDGGESWDVISTKTKNNGFFEWNLLAFYDYWPAFRGKGDNCLIKIESSDNPEIFDISEGSFKIYGEGSEIRITTRLLNKRYNPGEEMLLEWESKNLMAYEVSIYFSENGGVTWSQIVDITDDDGEISIKIPEIEFTSDNCFIKIEKYEDSSVYDVSNSFTVFGEPSLDITFPNGGNQLQGLRIINIKWTSRNLKKSRIDMFFIMNNDEQWTTIKKGVPDNGSFIWMVPEITSDNCRIKLIASKFPEVHDISTEKFTIQSNPELFFTSNFNLINWEYNYSYPIEWKSEYLEDELINIYYSTNAGQSWSLINIVENTGKTTISTPVIPETSNQCKLKLDVKSAADVTAVTKGLFTIKGKPIVTIISPNGGESIPVNSNWDIRWEPVNITYGTIDLSLSLDKGQNWRKLVKVNINDKEWNWSTPNLSKTNSEVFLKISNNLASDISDGSFTIKTRDPHITVHTPNGGETYICKTGVPITWEAVFLIDEKIKIDYSRDNGNSWKNIVRDLPNTGSFIWNIPNTIETRNNCLIRVSDNDIPDFFDLSDAVFTITEPPSIQVSIMEQKHTFYPGDVLNLHWKGHNLSSDKVIITYSVNKGLSWKKVVEKNKSKGNYNWTVPDIGKHSNKCMLKIYVKESPEIFGKSEIFTINKQSAIVVSKPTSGDKIKEKKGVYISWTTNNDVGQEVDIYYSLDEGIKWTFIKTLPASTGNMIWKVPDVDKSYPKCKVKIVSNKDKSLLGFSRGFFTIRSN